MRPGSAGRVGAGTDPATTDPGQVRSGGSRRRSRSPSRPEARALTSIENNPTSVPAEQADLEHAETGAPDPEQIEQSVEELGGAPVNEDSPLFSDFDVHPDVVGTPGRLLDLAQQGHLILGKVKVLVLDEADEMLDLGFLPDIERILAMVPDKRQTMLFSATMPGPIVTLSRSFMTQPTHIRAHGNDEGSTVPQTTQFIYRAHNLDKPELLSRVLQARGRGLVMVFCRTKRTAQKVPDDLVERGFAAAAVHGDLGQGAREQALRAFRSGKVDVLVATDVAARGIDVTGVTHVVNYQCPEDEKTYVHRIGRTGRAGHTGVAVTLVDWDDVPRWRLISKALGLD